MELRSLSLLLRETGLQARSSWGTTTVDPLCEVSPATTDPSGVGANDTTLSRLSTTSSPGASSGSVLVSGSDGAVSSLTRSNSPASPKSKSHLSPRCRSRSSRAPCTCSTRTEFGRLQSNTKPATENPRRARSRCLRYSYSTAEHRSAIASTSANSNTIAQGTGHLPSATSRREAETMARACSLCARASSWRRISDSAAARFRRAFAVAVAVTHRPAGRRNSGKVADKSQSAGSRATALRKYLHTLRCFSSRRW
mmetsp:Transcript_11263/g.24891  ORF Transcript_11263/g.24891 Transcript_11263/m.24891 type:complete len:254 (-) Transcript_11263:255-1016(-)